MARMDIAFTTGGVYGPQVTVNPDDSDTFSLVEAFAVFLRYFGEHLTVSQKGDAYILQGPTTEELGEAEFDYEGEFQEAFGVLEDAGLMASPPPEEPETTRDPKTGLAIPANGFPWTDTKGPVSLKTTTDFKQGDLVKVIRVVHNDDRDVLDEVGNVIGVDRTHTNGQTVHVVFWDLDRGEDKPFWVHHDALQLVYRPGSSS